MYFKPFGLMLILLSVFSASAAPTASPRINGPTDAAINKTYTINWSSVSNSLTYTLKECKGSSCNTTKNLSSTSITLRHAYTGTREYSVKACDASGCGAYGNTHRVNVYGPPWQRVSVSVPSSSPINHRYTVSWPTVNNATSYTLRECKGNNCNETRYITQTQFSISHQYTGSRTYMVKACNDAGCASYGASSSINIYGPPTRESNTRGPASVHVNQPYDISWDSVSGATSYTLLECKGASCNETRNINNTIYRNIRHQYTGTRSYQVKACNLAGCTGYGNRAYVNVTAPPPPLPTKPQFDATMTSGITLHHPFTLKWHGASNAKIYVIARCIDDTCIEHFATVSAPTIHFDSTLSDTAANTLSFKIKACNDSGCSANNSKTLSINTTNKIKSTLLYVGNSNTVTNNQDIVGPLIDWSNNQDNRHIINRLGAAGVNRLIVTPSSHDKNKYDNDKYYSFNTFHTSTVNYDAHRVICKPKPDETQFPALSANFSSFQADLNKIIELIKSSDYKDKMKIWVSTPPVIGSSGFYPSQQQVTDWVNWLKQHYLGQNNNHKQYVDGIYMYDENYFVCDDRSNPGLNYLSHLRRVLDTDPELQGLSFVWAPHRGAIYKNGEFGGSKRTHSNALELLTQGSTPHQDWEKAHSIFKQFKAPIFDYVFLQPNVFKRGWENNESVTGDNWLQKHKPQWDLILNSVKNWVSTQTIYQHEISGSRVGLVMEADRYICQIVEKPEYLDPSKKYYEKENMYKYNAYLEAFSHLSDQTSHASVPLMFYFDAKHTQTEKQAYSYQGLLGLVTSFYKGQSSNLACD
ncbi:hypothetical protein [Pseudoalteromonas luteoviolacea]|uniref:Fibronectin type III domain protein n=1 Tax=Pseudoalteromonas luteoviolacea (strain 2ta16) TaxID=1353533 RepID=V4HVY2_PSEL2|nr:hypothetical protein [Pseudoalteromonas luteoviolacea]ESP94970.1 hypothetical protein PL2TA16_04526 [Pseudoalteromonas luteoviolacea 2ta16]KZN36301.1 hypothetical protein N483_22585 [Pseudoalteromonas luteoviolacea NCIMB 1944]